MVGYLFTSACWARYLHRLRKAALRSLTEVEGIAITVFMMGAEP